MARTRAIIVVPAAFQAQANAAAKAVDPVGGERTFTVGRILSARPDAHPIPDAYVCNWQFEGNELDRFKSELLTRGVSAATKIYELDSPDPAVARPREETVNAAEGIKRPRR